MTATPTRWVRLREEAAADQTLLKIEPSAWRPAHGQLLWSPLSSEVLRVLIWESISGHLELTVQRGAYVVVCWDPGLFGLDAWKGPTPLIHRHTWLATLEP